MNTQFLTSWFSSQGDVLAAATGCLTFTLLLWVWFGLVERDPSASRVKAIAARRRELRSGSTASRARRVVSKGGLLAAIVGRLKLVQSSQSERLKSRLSQAGIRATEARYLFLIGKLLAPFALGMLAFALVYGTMLATKPPAVQFAIMIGGVTLGFFLPDLVVANRIAKRRLALQKTLPDGLDLLVVCAEAGLSLDVALQRVAQEMGPAAPELAEELELTSLELNFMPERRQALQNLAARVDLPTMRGVVNTLIQTEKYGTPLSQSLRVLSAEFRDQRMMKAEEKAARLPAIMTVPMIAFILPTLFIVLIGPAVIKVYDSFINR